MKLRAGADVVVDGRIKGDMTFETGSNDVRFVGAGSAGHNPQSTAGDGYTMFDVAAGGALKMVDVALTGHLHVGATGAAGTSGVNALNGTDGGSGGSGGDGGSGSWGGIGGNGGFAGNGGNGASGAATVYNLGTMLVRGAWANGDNAVLGGSDQGGVGGTGGQGGGGGQGADPEDHGFNGVDRPMAGPARQRHRPRR